MNLSENSHTLNPPRPRPPATNGGYGVLKILNNGGGLKKLNINGWVGHNGGAGGEG